MNPDSVAHVAGYVHGLAAGGIAGLIIGGLAGIVVGAVLYAPRLDETPKSRLTLHRGGA